MPDRRAGAELRRQREQVAASQRSMANFAAADQAGLVRVIIRKLKKIRYRPHLIDGCLADTGLKVEPW